MRHTSAVGALGLLSAALILAGCAPEPGNRSPAPTATPTATSFITPEPSSSARPTPTPTPMSDGRRDMQVTFVTLDLLDGVIEATGMVSGVAEDGGVCTLTIEHDGESKSAGAQGTAGPVSTYCGLMTIPTDGLIPGDWSATIEYSSTGYRGASETQVVVVR